MQVAIAAVIVFLGGAIVAAPFTSTEKPTKLATAATTTVVGTTATTLSTTPATTPATTTFPPARTKTAGCVMSGALPDRACTPGAINSAVTQSTIGQTICTSGFAETVRPATADSDRLKDEAAEAYGITDSLSNYQGDHLIPLELGGAADDLANFWDQPDTLTLEDGTVVASGQKDALETYLKDAVCAGRMTLADAQRQIAVDWYAAWVGNGKPGGSTAAVSSATTVPPSTTTAAPSTATTAASVY